jgi:hypothetical protein
MNIQAPIPCRSAERRGGREFVVNFPAEALVERIWAMPAR